MNGLFATILPRLAHELNGLSGMKETFRAVTKLYAAKIDYALYAAPGRGLTVGVCKRPAQIGHFMC
jgi:hypothetical protein